MNTKEKYNELIEFIENAVVTNIDSKPAEIAETLVLQKGQGRSPRDISALIDFMTGETLALYIKSRLMNRAYCELIENSDADINDIISFTGYSDQPSFIKAFRSQYDMTPLNAAKKKDKSLIKPAKSWDYVSANVNDLSVFKPIEENILDDEIQRFGIPQRKYDLLLKTLDLQAIYGFSQDESETAFSIADMFDVDIRKAYEFVEECKIMDMEEEIRQVLRADKSEPQNRLANLIYIFINFDMSINQSSGLLIEFEKQGIKNVNEENLDLLKSYLHDWKEYRFECSYKDYVQVHEFCGNDKDMLEWFFVSGLDSLDMDSSMKNYRFSIVKSKAEQLGIDAPYDVIQSLVNSPDNNVEHLDGAINMLTSFR